MRYRNKLDAIAGWIRHHKKQAVIHGLIISAFIIYAGLANVLFPQADPVPGEAAQYDIRLPDATNNIDYGISYLLVTEKAMEIGGWAVIRGAGADDSRIFLVLKSGSGSYAFDTLSLKGLKTASAFKETGLNSDGSRFSAVVPLREVKNGEYRIGVYIEKSNVKALEYTRRALIKDGSRAKNVNLSVYPAGETAGMTSYTLRLSSRLKVAASSFNKDNESEQSLIDDNADSYWHIAYPPQSATHWVSFDFGETVTIKSVALLPRQDVSQLWSQQNAVLQISGDPSKKGWESIVGLNIEPEKLLVKGDWLHYDLAGNSARRYYRILVNDSGFYSLAGIRFWVSEPH